MTTTHFNSDLEIMTNSDRDSPDNNYGLDGLVMKLNIVFRNKTAWTSIILP